MIQAHLVGSAKIFQNLLDEEFTSTVRVSAFAGRMFFGQRQKLRLTVDSRRRAEYEFEDAVLGHYLKQNRRSSDVVLVILKRLMT